MEATPCCVESPRREQQRATEIGKVCSFLPGFLVTDVEAARSGGGLEALLVTVGKNLALRDLEAGGRRQPRASLHLGCLRRDPGIR